MTGFTVLTARAALVAALGVLCAAQGGQGVARADAPDGGMETAHGPSLITVDNSNADSWLEVDRTLNILAPLSKGTAGSDHDGGGGAIEQHLSGPSKARLQAAPVERGTETDDDDEESAATGGDDPEGDADRERDTAHGAPQPQAEEARDTGPRAASPCTQGAPGSRDEHAACP